MGLMERLPWAHEETRYFLKKAIRGDAKALAAAFDWNSAPGGAAYWRDVYNEARERGYVPGDAQVKLATMATEFFGGRDHGQAA